VSAERGAGERSGGREGSEGGEKVFILDSYALLALLGDEEGAGAVAELVEAEGIRLAMSVISLGEVRYVLLRRLGREAAEVASPELLAEEGIELFPADWGRVCRAAEIKARGGLSYADAFVVALALELGGTVVTGDPEFARAEEEVGILWLSGRGDRGSPQPPFAPARE